MKQSVNVQILRERKGLCFWEKKILKTLTGKYIKTFYLPGLRSWEMCLSTFVKYNVIENHTAWSKGAKSAATMRSDIICQACISQLLESNHQNIPGSTKMLWLNIRNKGRAQEAPLLFWVGFLWRKWNVIVIRSPGWRCLFYSLVCCNAQEAVGWRETREAPSHRIPWGLTGDEGMTGAEET